MRALQPAGPHPSASAPSTPTAPADPAAAASSGTDGASAGATEHMASQVHTRPLICRRRRFAKSEVVAALVCACCSGYTWQAQHHAP